MRDAARDALYDKTDPALLKRQPNQSSPDTFEAIAREWITKKSSGWSEGHTDRTLRRFEVDIFPEIGALSIKSVDAPILLKVLQRMEKRGVTDTVLRARENCGAVFRYGIATGRCSQDPAASLRGAIIAKPVKHHAAIIDPQLFAQLLRDIDGYGGTLAVKCALRLSPLLALRPGEVRNLEWSEVNLSGQEIRIPGRKMKMKSDHIVPLSIQAIDILMEIQPLTAQGRYVFPSSRNPRGDRPMSENTINAALRQLGYEKETHSAHGFRSSFSSICNEKLNFTSDAIERQLAHAERNKVRAAYLHTEFLPERRRLMQAWADYLDQLRRS